MCNIQNVIYRGEMETRRMETIIPNNKQDTESSNPVKQIIKVQKSDDNRLSKGRFFTIAHLYLTPASLSRQNTIIEENKHENKT